MVTGRPRPQPSLKGGKFYFHISAKISTVTTEITAKTPKAFVRPLANPRLLGPGENGGMHGYTLQSISCFLTLLKHGHFVICLFMFASFPATNVAEIELPAANLLILSLGRPAC